jgi:lysophospholipase L1-like esterase
VGNDPQLELQVRGWEHLAKLAAAVVLLALAAQLLLYLLAAVARQGMAYARGEVRNGRTFMCYLGMSILSVVIFLSCSLLLIELGLRWYYSDVMSTARVSYFYNRSLKKFLAERNALGFRGEHFDIRNKSGVYRIVVIGDSLAYGQGVLPHSDRFTEQFAGMLRQKYPSLDFEVINIGISGMNLPQHLWFLSFTLKLDPDYILYQWFINDMEVSRDGSAFRTPRFPLPRGWNDSLMENSVLYFLLHELYREVRVATGRQMSYSQYMTDKLRDPDSRGSVQADEALNELISKIRGKGIPMGIVLFPGFTDLEDYELGFLHDRVLAVCRDRQIQCLDLRPAYQPYNERIKDLWVNPFDAHPSKLAHRIAAERIFDTFAPAWTEAAREQQADGRGVDEQISATGNP